MAGDVGCSGEVPVSGVDTVHDRCAGSDVRSPSASPVDICDTMVVPENVRVSYLEVPRPVPSVLPTGHAPVMGCKRKVNDDVGCSTGLPNKRHRSSQGFASIHQGECLVLMYDFYILVVGVLLLLILIICMFYRFRLGFGSAFYCAGFEFGWCLWLSWNHASSFRYRGVMCSFL